MKLYLLLCCCLLTNSLSGKIKSNDIYQSWVLVKVTYDDESELPDEHMIKYTYQKFTFKSPDVLNIALKYNDLGTSFNFEIRNDKQLLLKTPQGYVMNQMQIEKS